jgi:purine-binding chemotaxis protein CheW
MPPEATSSFGTATRERADAALLVRLGGRQYALPLASVDRVLPMAYVLSLPDHAEGLLGMLNLHGQVLPVIDPYARLGLSSPPVAAEHRLVLLRGNTSFLLWVEDVEEVVNLTAADVNAVPTQQSSPLVPRVLRLGDELVPLLAPTALGPRGSAR